MSYAADLHDKLARDIDTTTWRELRAHAARDKVFLVAPGVPLVDAAVAVALDDSARVGAWIAAGVLTRPSALQLEAWERALDKPFSCVIVSPWVLAAEALV